MTQSTLVLIKPDCVRRRMLGQVISALEGLGLFIQALEQKRLSIHEAETLYKEHKGKWHFPRNIRHITSGPVVAIQVDGDDAPIRCRDFVERFRKAHEDIIQLPRNLVHATSDPSQSDYELKAVGLLK